MLVIAHRGANKEAPENSWSAFEKAIEGGSDRIELDAQMTRDGIPVVIHDSSLQRVFGVAGQVQEVSFEDFKKLTLADGRPAPTVAEVISQLLSQVELNIEIKGKDLGLAGKVCELVQQCDQPDRIILSTPWAEVGEFLKETYPDLKRACLTGFVDGLAWPHFSFQAPPILMNAVNTPIIHPRVQTVDHNFMDQARNRGWIVYPWVTMDAEEQDKEGLWAHLAFLGVDGLCTNYPRQLKGWLDEARFDGTSHQQALLAQRQMADRLHTG